MAALRYNPRDQFMSTNISTDFGDEAAPRPRKHFMCTALWVAAIANALVPAVFFSETALFGPSDPRYRALVTIVLLVEYSIVFLFVLLHANVGFASGYAVATASIVTVGSALLAWINLYPAAWHWAPLYIETLVLAGMAFAVLANVVFLIASIRYARAIHPRLHLGGFFLGIGASVALVLIYGCLLP
jgi:hypothetical protein